MILIDIFVFRELKAYFENTYDLDESIFVGLKGSTTFLALVDPIFTCIQYRKQAMGVENTHFLRLILAEFIRIVTDK